VWENGAWQPPQVVDRAARMTSVSCPSLSFCVAVDTKDHAVSYDGTSWSSPRLIDRGNGAFNSVSCPSAVFCVAVDATGHAVTFNGTSWSNPVLIDSHPGQRRTSGLTAVSCASSSFCAAVDDVGFATIFNGTTWSEPQSVSEDFRLSSVSCTSPTWCIAAGTGIWAYDGSGWTFQHSPNGYKFITTVSCASSTFCVELFGEYAATYNGSSWTGRVSLNWSGPHSVSCPSASFCAAVDLYGQAVTYRAG
jgi:hypothetical protein